MSSFTYDIPITNELINIVKSISDGKIPIKVKCHRQVMIVYITFSDGSDAKLNVWTGCVMRDKNFMALYELIAY
jgi:hypothetical protein